MRWGVMTKMGPNYLDVTITKSLKRIPLKHELFPKKRKKRKKKVKVKKVTKKAATQKKIDTLGDTRKVKRRSGASANKVIQQFLKSAESQE